MIRRNPDGSITVGAIPTEPQEKNEPAPVKKGGKSTKK